MCDKPLNKPVGVSPRRKYSVDLFVSDVAPSLQLAPVCLHSILSSRLSSSSLFSFRHQRRLLVVCIELGTICFKLFLEEVREPVCYKFRMTERKNIG